MVTKQPETAITDKDKDAEHYDWKSSNPKGYAEWFDERKQYAYRLIERKQRETLQKNFSEIYAKVEDVPDQLIKTPLQRVIQLLKRHRDIRFNGSPNEKDKPISMIITTLSANAYASETDVFSAFWNTINSIKRLKKENGIWYSGFGLLGYQEKFTLDLSIFSIFSRTEARNDLFH